MAIDTRLGESFSQGVSILPFVARIGSELRENIEGKNDTIASVLNELAGQGRLRCHKEG